MHVSVEDKSANRTRFVEVIKGFLLWVSSIFLWLLAWGNQMNVPSSKAYIPLSAAGLILLPPFRTLIRRVAPKIMKGRLTTLLAISFVVIGLILIGDDDVRNKSVATASEPNGTPKGTSESNHLTPEADVERYAKIEREAELRKKAEEETEEYAESVKKAEQDRKLKGNSSQGIQSKLAAKGSEATDDDSDGEADNSIVTDVRLEDLIDRMNRFEAQISDPPLYRINEISNDEVFTRTFRTINDVELIVVQNKKFQRIRDATLVWQPESPEANLAGMLQLTALVGAMSPDVPKRRRNDFVLALMEGIKDGAPIRREIGKYRFSCFAIGAIMCTAESKKAPVPSDR